MVSEQTIITEIRKGNRSAMKMLYDRYSGYATAVCLRYLTDSEAVKDVLQDSFVKILTSIPQFEYRGEGSLRAWICRIAANRSLDYLKENNRFCFTNDIPQEPEDDAPETDDIPLEQLMKMIGELPVGYRTVFNLYVFEEKSHKEIARMLGIKENSSASQYARAKKMLCNLVEDYIRKQG